MLMRPAPEPVEHKKRALRNTAAGAAYIVFVLAVAMLMAWYTDGLWLKAHYPAAFQMKYNTALAFAAASGGILALLVDRRPIALGASAIVLAIASITLLEYATGHDLLIDQLFRRDIHYPDSPYPGRVSPGTCVAFVCAGLHLLLSALDRKSRIVIAIFSELFAFLTFALGAAGMIGYLEGNETAYTWGSYARMSPHTASGFMLVGAALMAMAWYRQDTRVARIPLWAPALVCFTVLMLDIATPLGVATGIAYIPLVFCGLWFTRSYATIVFAAIGTILSILAVPVKPPSDAAMTIVFANRVITVGAIWFVAALVYLRRASERAYQRSESRLRAVVDHAVDGIITINANGIIEQVNPACERIFGYSAAEMVGRNVKMLMPEPYHGEHDHYIARHRDTGEARIIGTAGREVSGRRRDGSVFPVDLSISAMRFSDGAHYCGVVRDITDRKDAQIRLLRYTKELERSNQELDDFAYIASHDLKEPLRGLFNNARFLMEDYHDKIDGEGQKRLHRLGYLTQRLEQLVNDLLYFSRLGRQEMSNQSTDLNDVVRDVELLLETTLQEKNATINVPSRLPVIKCDTTRVAEIFHNLVTNAVKYNDREEKVIEIGSLDSMPEADVANGPVFYVRDNGIGIDPQFHSEIFRIFKRLNEEDDSKKGTGVGLTFVRKIIERHGGRIWVDSAPGEGTTFYFTLKG